MIVERSIIRQAARTSGISEEDLSVFFAEGRQQVYQANEWLFQESTPRRWASRWRRWASMMWSLAKCRSQTGNGITGFCK